MLTVSIDPENSCLLTVKCPFYAKERLKYYTNDAVLDWDRKVWLVQRNDIDILINTFRGEIYFKTPEWFIKNQPMPDMRKMYYVDPNIVLPDMKVPLFDYQVFGARFMIDRMLRNGLAINADGCGLGKTATSLSVMQWFKENKGAKKFLIIAKKTIKEQWAREITHFTTFPDIPNFPIVYTPDLKKKREETYKTIYEAGKGILITNYENFLNDTKSICPIDFDMAIVDEAHCVKAHDGIKNNNIGSVISKCPTVFLTGTPILSRPEDVFGIVQMSKPNYFGDWESFKNRYLVMEDKGYYQYAAGAKNLDELRALVQDIVIRRTEYEISVSLPEVLEKNIVILPDKTQERIFAEIALQCDSYENEVFRLTEQLKRKGGSQTDRKKRLERLEAAQAMLKGYISCKQFAATDPITYSYSTSKMLNGFSKFVSKKYKMSPKTEAIINEVKEILDNDEKIILFSKFATICRYMSDVLSRELKENVLLYTGKQNSRQRTRNVDLFRTRDDYNILIGSDAMAEGLNLAEARHIINIDLPDTYAIYQQRVGRARRVSSTYSNVVVHNCLTDRSVDISKFDNLDNNKDLDGALVGVDQAQSEALKKTLIS